MNSTFEYLNVFTVIRTYTFQIILLHILHTLGFIFNNGSDSWVMTNLRSCLFQLILNFEGSILENPKVGWLPESRIETPSWLWICELSLAHLVRFLMVEYVLFGLSHRLRIGAPIFLYLLHDLSSTIIYSVVGDVPINSDAFNNSSISRIWLSNGLIRVRSCTVFIGMSVCACIWASAPILCFAKKNIGVFRLIIYIVAVVALWVNYQHIGTIIIFIFFNWCVIFLILVRTCRPIFLFHVKIIYIVTGTSQVLVSVTTSKVKRFEICLDRLKLNAKF
jgi:hypothetical protein